MGKASLKEKDDLACWSEDNNLSLNISKTKELIADFGKKHGNNYTSLSSTSPQQRGWAAFMCLGVHITGGRPQRCILTLHREKDGLLLVFQASIQSHFNFDTITSYMLHLKPDGFVTKQSNLTVR
ncbi:hypothetical protein L3Q82_004155 [Scortum barcoo]|uniref:Uncharacterized protein n=1 Tax=Scortum barcoo TaxID=214431 RepID=A0ACB8X845_9TELE|nr:hypothetical protein L3Q82_004155 [Scortum barcoo]